MPNHSYKKLNKNFDNIDRNQSIIDFRIGRWSSWAVVRRALWLNLFYTNASQVKTVSQFIKNFIFYFIQSIYIPILSIFVHILQKKDPLQKIVILYNSRKVTCPDNILRNYYFSDILELEKIKLKIIKVEYPWPPDRKLFFPKKKTYSALPRLFWTKIISPFLPLQKEILSFSENLSAIISKNYGLNSKKFINNFLKSFSINKFFFKRFLLRHNARVLVLTDANGKIAEIAAAKELNIPVVELQHGIFGIDDPDYNWPQEFKKIKDNLPIPDYILCHGPMWRENLIKNNFWEPSKVLISGHPLISYFKDDSIKKDHFDKEKIKVLFITQRVNRQKLIDFISAFLSLSSVEKRNMLLQLKPHPNENNDLDVYKKLSQKFRNKIVLLDPNDNIFNAIKKSDLVIGFHSATLIEAITLGVPTVSIVNGAAEDGLSSIISLPNLSKVVPHIKTAKEFCSIIQNSLHNPSNYAKWCKQTKALGTNVYSGDFINEFRKAIKIVSS